MSLRYEPASEPLHILWRDLHHVQTPKPQPHKPRRISKADLLGVVESLGMEINPDECAALLASLGEGEGGERAVKP